MEFSDRELPSWIEELPTIRPLILEGWKEGSKEGLLDGYLDHHFYYLSLLTTGFMLVRPSVATFLFRNYSRTYEIGWCGHLKHRRHLPTFSRKNYFQLDLQLTTQSWIVGSFNCLLGFRKGNTGLTIPFCFEPAGLLS